MFTLLDIAYTGGNYRRDSIVELAMLLHNGEQITDEWYSTIKPAHELSDFTLAMLHLPRHQVSQAPIFEVLAPHVADFCAGTVLVGLNVRHIYALLLQAFSPTALRFQRPQICLSKLIAAQFGNIPAMTLSGVCEQYGIAFNTNYSLLQRTRTIATVFEHLYIAQQTVIDKRTVRKTTATVKYPPQLPPDRVEQLPNTVGVYYFTGKRGQMLYLGKSNDIKKRVMTHFADDLHSNDKLQLKREICDIQYRLTGSELVALLLESDEIKRYMPTFNRAQRRKVYTQGIYCYTDETGYACLRHSLIQPPPEEPLLRFSSKWQAVNFLWYAAQRYQLSPQRCGIANYEKWLLKQDALPTRPDSIAASNDVDNEDMKAVLPQKEVVSTTSVEAIYNYDDDDTSPEQYNIKVAELVAHYSYPQPNMLIIDKGRNGNEVSVIWIDNNKYRGYAYLPPHSATDITQIQTYLIPMRENPDVQGIIRGYLRRHADKLRIVRLPCKSSV